MTDPTPADPTPPPADPTPPAPAPAPASTPPPASAPPAASTTWTPPASTAAAPARPTGITILSILAGLGAIGTLLAAFAALGIGSYLFGLSGTIFALAWLALGGLELSFGIGAWQMKPWAWPLGVVLAAGAIIWSIITLLGAGNLFSTLITVVIWGIVLYYLNQPTIKSLFGRA